MLNVVYAVPQIPTQYYGVVSNNGNPISGKYIIVKDSDNNQVSVNVQESDANGIYITHVMWDDPDTLSDEGVNSGEQIYFYIENVLIREITVGSNGDILELPLAISGKETSSSSFRRPTDDADIETGETKLVPYDDKNNESVVQEDYNIGLEPNILENNVNQSNEKYEEEVINNLDDSNDNINKGPVNIFIIMLGVALLFGLIYIYNQRH